MLRDDVTTLLASIISSAEKRLSLARALGSEGLVAYQAGKQGDYVKANDSIAAMERLREEFTALGVTIARSRDDLCRICGLPPERMKEIWDQAVPLKEEYQKIESAIIEELTRAEGYMESLSKNTGNDLHESREDVSSLRKTAMVAKKFYDA